MAKDSEYINMQTPIGTFRFIYLARQDTKFDPKYSVDLIIEPGDNEDHATFMERVEELNAKIAEELRKTIKTGAKSYNVKEIFRELEDEDGNPTGKYFLKATTKTKPVVVDAAKKVIPDDVINRCYSGTKGRLILGLRKSIVPGRKTIGFTVYLNKVQITEPVFGSTSDFDAVDGGYTSGVSNDTSNSESPDF
jgi:hypothetical protein